MAKIIIREIEEDDLEKEFLESLDFLRKASNIDKNKAYDILKKIKQNPDHIIHVALDGNKIVGSTTLLIFSKEAPYLRVFPVTTPSASPQETIQEAQITLSFLTSRSQSRSSKPCSLCIFLNKKSTYFSLFFLSVELLISISKF